MITSMKGVVQSALAAGLFAGVILVGGCTQTRLTHPKRSAVEQLLFSTAADRAWAQIDRSVFAGRTVFVDDRYLETDDELYVVGTLRDVLSSSGALLSAGAEEAEIIIEPRSGALSIDSSESLLGIPALPVPVPFAGVLETPELALLKSEKQFSTAKFALLALDRNSRKHVASSGTLVGRANIRYYKILGLIKFTRTTVPEKQKGAER